MIQNSLVVKEDQDFKLNDDFNGRIPVITRIL